MALSKNRAFVDVETEHPSRLYFGECSAPVRHTERMHAAEKHDRGFCMRMREGLSRAERVGTRVRGLMIAVGEDAFVPFGMRATGRRGAPAGLVKAFSGIELREATDGRAHGLNAQGCNPRFAQHVTACFPPSAARFCTPRGAPRVRLTAWRRPGGLTMLALASGPPHDHRVEYRGSVVRAWRRALPRSTSGESRLRTLQRVVITPRARRMPLAQGDHLAWGAFRYGKQLATNTVGRVLSATFTFADIIVTIRFGAAHARYPLSVDPLARFKQEAIASEELPRNWRGSSVALGRATAMAEADNVRNWGVPACVYIQLAGSRANTSIFCAELRARDKGGNDRIGKSVALSVTAISVREFGLPAGCNANQGAACLFDSACPYPVLSTPATKARGRTYTSQTSLASRSASASLALAGSSPVPTGTNYVLSNVTPRCCSKPAGMPTCNLSRPDACRRRASASVTLRITAPAVTALADSADRSLSTPALSRTLLTRVATAQAIVDLANMGATIVQKAPPASPTITGSGALPIAASPANAALLSNTGLDSLGLQEQRRPIRSHRDATDGAPGSHQRNRNARPSEFVQRQRYAHGERLTVLPPSWQKNTGSPVPSRLAVGFPPDEPCSALTRLQSSTGELIRSAAPERSTVDHAETRAKKGHARPRTESLSPCHSALVG